MYSYSLFISDADGSREHPLLPGTGSNYNASFSADGRWIVFTSDRSGSANIYRVHPDGSGLEQLTHGPTFNDQGSLSPDARTLAFVSTRGGGTANIWLLDLATGHVRNLTQNTAGNFRPSWSRDGRWIAFSSDRNTPLTRYVRPTGAPGWEQVQLTAIYIVRRDGGRLRRLTPLDGVAESPKWSPDGRHVVYNRISDLMEMQHGMGSGRPEIVSFDLVTSTARAVSAGSSFAVSPQYVSEGEIGYLESKVEKGGQTYWLAYSSGRKSEQRAPIIDPSWSPDGATVVYYRRDSGPFSWAQVLPVRDARYELIGGRPFFRSQVAFTARGDRFYYSSVAAADGAGTRIEVATLEGNGTRTVYDTGDPKRTIGSLSLSPDESQLAIQIGGYFRRPVRPGEISFVNVDGSGFHTAISGSDNNGFPAYSPDGKRVVFRVLGSQRGLRILSLKDASVRTLTEGWDNFPAWSPVADIIAFTRLEDNAFEIYTIRSDGSGLRKLTHSHGTDAHPVWSPDGRWLAFESARRGWKDESRSSEQTYGEVFVMRADGSAVRQVTDNQFEEGILAWLPAAAGRLTGKEAAPRPNVGRP